MEKIQFEIVNSQVEDFFDSPLREDETVDQRLIVIEEFIGSCGWSVDEFELFREYGILN